MKKVLFLIVASLFIFSGMYGAEGLADENNNSNIKAMLMRGVSVFSAAAIIIGAIRNNVKLNLYFFDMPIIL